jgi:CHAD domain-containing protein
MRVAARRLRSAISLFSDFLPPDWTRGLSGELKWFAQELGAAREWDVFLAETLAPLHAALGGEECLASLGARAAAERDAAYVRVRATLADPRYTRMLLRLAGALEVLPDAPGADSLVVTAARTLLDTRHDRVRRGARNPGRLDSAGMHRLRIRFKKLRYAAEFLAGALDRPKRAGRYVGAAKAVQDDLGIVQDVATTPELLASLGGGKDLDRARALITGWQAAHASDARSRLVRTIKRFRKVATFW